LPWIARFTAASRPERARASSRVIRELALASLDMHAALAGEGLDTGLVRTGSLNVLGSDAAFSAAKREAEEARREGLRVEVLERGQAREFEPALSGEHVGAVYYPDDAHCDPYRFVQAVGRAAVEAGARVCTRVEVLALRRSNGRVERVQTTAGDIRAGTFVVAAGAWSPLLTRGLGVYMPIEGGKGYHVDLEAAAGDPRLPVWFQESRVIATPLPGRLRLAGTLELAGLDERVSRRRVEAIVKAARRGIAGLEGRRVLEVWRGLRPCTPDGLPLLGRVEAPDNLVLATGHAMMGLTLAPVTGRLVAEVIVGEPPSHDLRPVRPSRFQPLLGRD
jgi:D-amino-acid dehydrogenase